MGFFLLCNITNKIAPRYKNLLGEYFSRLCIINKKGPEMTKNEQIEALKAQLAEQMKGKDPYYEEQRRLIMKMPIELIKFRIPKT